MFIDVRTELSSCEPIEQASAAVTLGEPFDLCEKQQGAWSRSRRYRTILSNAPDDLDRRRFDALAQSKAPGQSEAVR